MQEKYIKVDEYIELLNSGYIPRHKDREIVFKNGESVNHFWANNKERIINKLNNDPKYKVGYDTAKEIVQSVKIKPRRQIEYLKKVDEYIELMNSGYVPKVIDKVNYFTNGDKIKYFWLNNKEKIVYELYNNPKYQKGYDIAKDTLAKIKVSYSSINNTKIAKDQILKYLGIEIKQGPHHSLKSIIKNECFNQHVSKQNKWIKETYINTLKKLDILDTLDEAKIADIISYDIITNCLEKEERKEFKDAILSYLNKVKELQKLDIAFEEDNQKKFEKIKKYNFDEFDIEECVLISLEFNQEKLIEPTTDLYKRRKLISSYIIDWDELTDLEKENIIKQNNFTIEEISLINEKQEEIKVLKKMM